MRQTILANWNAGLLVFVGILAIAASYATNQILQTMDTTEADLSLTFRRCVIDAPNGLHLNGFTPISRCVLYNTDRITLGPGRLVLEDGVQIEASDLELVLTSRHAPAFTSITGRDLAIGNIAMPAGILEARSQGIDEFRLDVSLSLPGSSSRGELSLGDSCAIQASGYEFRVSGEPIPGHSVPRLKALFLPLSGAGRFVDADEWGCQARMIDQDILFSEPTRIAHISFLNAADQCADVLGGEIRIGKAKRISSVPLNSCVRLDAQELLLRQIGMPWNSRDVSVEMNGRFNSLVLNGVSLFDRDVPIALVVGLTVLLAFIGLVIWAKRFFGKGAGHPSENSRPEQVQMADSIPVDGPGHVFISYRRKDAIYVGMLSDKIRRMNLEAWTDTMIRCGDNWPQVLDEKIRECFALVLVMGSESANSHYQDKEIALAQRYKRPIIPLLLAGEGMHQVAGIHAYDVRKQKLLPADFFNHLKHLQVQWRKHMNSIQESFERRSEEYHALTARGKTVFGCNECLACPMTYESLSGLAMGLLLGFPFIGGTLLQHFHGWLYAFLFVAISFYGIVFLISRNEHLFKEPPLVCPECGLRPHKNLLRRFKIAPGL